MRIGVWMTVAALALAGCNQDNMNRPAANNSTSNTNQSSTDNQNKPVTTAKPAIGGGNTPATSATPNTNTSGTNAPGATTNNSDEPVRPDNTGVNKRDQDDRTILPTDQGSSQADTEMVAEIRREVLEIDDLSFNGRQVKIIVKDGKVTLRGPVASDTERKAIEDVATRVAKEGNVTNALEVAP